VVGGSIRVGVHGDIAKEMVFGDEVMGIRLDEMLKVQSTMKISHCYP
jgi:hypothetical protein